MSSKFIPAALAAILVASPMAVLARSQGAFSDVVVQSVSPSAMTVTMADGNTYDLAYAAQLNQLKAGDHVSFHWTDVNGGSRITDVHAAS
ncbi:MAG: DUF1344 domain-containing protein [Rhodobacteraceae bacterium]|nr:DUF1344 domain-containing protein [Paracoccaceae bacterium]